MRLADKVAVLAIAAMAVTLAAPADAAAETREYNAGGAAQGVGKQARTKAIDKAFAAAVTEGLEQVLTSAQRKEHSSVLRDNIIRRARLYVAGFRVLDERNIEGELRVQIVAKVDVGKLRSAIFELGIVGKSQPAPTFGGVRPAVVVLLKVSLGDATATTFGSTGGDGGATGRAIAKHLRDHGFKVMTVAGKQAPMSGEVVSGVPLGDDAAAELARSVGAGGAIVVGVGAEYEGRIRGTRLLGSGAVATVRVVDVSRGALVKKSQKRGAGFDLELGKAHGAAAMSAAASALAVITPKLESYWPKASSKPSADGIAIEISGARSWAPIGRIIRHLGKQRSIRAVHPISVTGTEVQLSVDTDLSATRLAAIIGGTELGSARAKARQRSGRVVVKISGSVR